MFCPVYNIFLEDRIFLSLSIIDKFNLALIWFCMNYLCLSIIFLCCFLSSFLSGLNFCNFSFTRWISRSRSITFSIGCVAFRICSIFWKGFWPSAKISGVFWTHWHCTYFTRRSCNLVNVSAFTSLYAKSLFLSISLQNFRSFSDISIFCLSIFYRLLYSWLL